MGRIRDVRLVNGSGEVLAAWTDFRISSENGEEGEVVGAVGREDWGSEGSGGTM